MVRVKICGITNMEDALSAAEHGADALGFVFYKGSPRYIAPEEAGVIICALPPLVTPVGVFVDAGAAEVREAVTSSGVRVLQFHGGETPGQCSSSGAPYIKSFRVRDMRSLEGVGTYLDAAAYLLDTYSESELGGTGVVFNWDIAVYAKRFGRIILAGGLTPDNVGRAVAEVMPYAVDVSSGVEASKGKKDQEKVKTFIAEVRRSDVTR
jgi:phosphoribosylanthranilate isomerase